MLRMCRTIQVEGAFGLMKHDFGFRRFFSTGKRNIRTELFFLAMGFNLKKRWMKQSRKREQFQNRTHAEDILIIVKEKQFQFLFIQCLKIVVVNRNQLFSVKLILPWE